MPVPAFRRRRVGVVASLLALALLAGASVVTPAVHAQLIRVDPINPDTGEKAGGDGDSASFLLGRNAYLQDRFGAMPGVEGNLYEKAVGAMREAMRQQRQEQAAAGEVAAQATGTWQPLGPAPIPNGSTYDVSVPTSGRMSSIAIHPSLSNFVLVGAAAGGVWRSTDGGTTMTAIFDGADSLSIGALALSPSDPSTLYVGTGEAANSCDSLGGVGLYRVTNVWTSPVLHGPINPGGIFSRASIAKIVVNPSNPDEVFVGAANAVSGIGCDVPQSTEGVFRSRNITAPASQVTFEELGALSEIFDLGLVGSSTLIAGGSSAVYRSTNRNDPAASVTFSNVVSTIKRSELDVLGNTVTVVHGSANGTVARSTDGGATFTTLSSNTSKGFCGGQCWYDLAVDVHPTNSNIILVGGAAGDGPGGDPDSIASSMLRSSDGATFQTAQSTLHADTHAIAFAPSLPQVVYAANDGGLWRSDDAGQTWAQRNTGLSGAQFQSVATHPTSPVLMMGGTQDNGTILRQSSGWRTVSGGDGGYSAFDQSSASTTNVTMYHTHYADIGRNFYRRFVGSPASAEESFDIIGCYNNISANGIGCSDNALFYPPLVLGPGTPNTVYFGTDRLYRSTDKGSTHAVVSQTFQGSISAVGIGPANDNLRVVGTQFGSLYRTTTGSSTLVQIDGNAWPDAFVSKIVIDPSNSNRAYVSLSKYFGDSTPHVWRTDNLLAATPSWIPASQGIPDVSVNTLIIDPENPERLYAGTTVGMFQTQDRGATWYPMMDGMPILPVFDVTLAMAGTSSQVLRAATHARGIWEFPIGNVYPRAALSPGTMGLGRRVVGGQSQAESFTLTNVGNGPLEVGAITPPGAAFPVVSDACSNVTLAPGAACSVSVRFAPTATGTFNSSIQFPTNALLSPSIGWVSGIGDSVPSPAVALSRSTVAFPGTVDGSESAQETVAITNTGDANLQLGDEAISGTSAGQFRIAASDCANRVLVPGGACTAALRFRPTSVGAKSATYSITSNAAGSPHTVALSGTGLTKPAPVFAAAPSSVAFGARQIGAPAATQQITVTNSGTGPFTINGIAVSGGPDFSVAAGTCNAVTLTPGQSCIATASFAPSGAGSRSGSVTFTTNASTSPHVIALSGSGTSAPAPAFSAAPWSLDYGYVATDSSNGETKGVTITNPGNATLSITGVSLTGSDAAHYSIASSGCTGVALAPAATCAVSVRFQPASAGTKSAAIRFATNALSVPDIALGGAGVAPGSPVLSYNPHDVTFAGATVGSSSVERAVVVSNVGTAPMTVGSVALGGADPGDFLLVADGCSLQTLMPSGNCTLLVRFTPAVAATRNASAAVPTNAGLGIVDLIGTGTAPGAGQASIAATTAFGPLPVGRTGLYRSVAVSNAGTGALTVTGAVVEGANPGDFSILDYCAGRTVSPGGTCTIYVAFTPAVTGARAASLRVMSNAAAVVSALSGTGTTPPASNPGVGVTPASATLGYSRIGGNGRTVTIAVSSTGQVPLVVGSIGLGGSAYDQFRITQDTCSGGTFSPAQSCTVTVRLTPTRPGPHSAGLIVTTNAGAPVVALTGTGDAVAPSSSITPNPASLVVRDVLPLTGRTTDDYAVAKVVVSYVNPAGAAQVVSATLTCGTAGTCSWSAAGPTLPGIYTVVVHGTDLAGNVESPGATTTVYAL